MKNDLVKEKEELQEHLSNSHQIKTKQKEFIAWLEKETKIIENKLNKYDEYFRHDFDKYVQDLIETKLVEKVEDR